MQVSLLKLNSGIGRAVETTATLERQNSQMEASIARLASGERIRAAADKRGMVTPAAGEVHYLRVRPGADAARAARRMRAPSDAARELMANAGVVPGSLAAAPATTTEPGATAAAPATDGGAGDRRHRDPASPPAVTPAPTPAAATPVRRRPPPPPPARAAPSPRPPPRRRASRAADRAADRPPLRGLPRLLALAGARAGWLGVVRADTLRKAAATQQKAKVTVPAERGAITDRNGIELAVSQPATTVAATPYLVKDPLQGRRQARASAADVARPSCCASSPAGTPASPSSPTASPPSAPGASSG